MRKWFADISPNQAPECWLCYQDNDGPIVRRQYYGSGPRAVQNVRFMADLQNEIEAEKQQ